MMNEKKTRNGEMTFTSASGVCHWNIPGINDKFGALLQLPERAYNVDTGEYFDPKITRPGLNHLEERCKAAWRLEKQYRIQLKRVADRDEWLGNFKKRVAARDEWLANEKKKVSIRDERIKKQNAQITELKTQLAAKNKDIVWLKKRKTGEDAEIKVLKAQLAARSKDIPWLKARQHKMDERCRCFQDEIAALKGSAAYRVGMFVTWPTRKLRGGVKCIRENGINYTIKHFVGKIAHCVGFRKVKW